MTETYYDCSMNCLEAKDLICRCKSHGKNNGPIKRTGQKPGFVEEHSAEYLSPEECLEELAVLC